MYDIFYRFYPYKLFLGKEGQDAVEDILETFSVLNDSKTERNVTSKVDVTKKAEDFLGISIRRDNTERSFHVSYKLFACIISMLLIIAANCKSKSILRLGSLRHESII